MLGHLRYDVLRLRSAIYALRCDRALLERIAARAARVAHEEAEQPAQIALPSEANDVWFRATRRLRPARRGIPHPADAHTEPLNRLTEHIDDPAYFIHEAPNEIDSGGPALLRPWKETAAAASAAALSFAFGHDRFVFASSLLSTNGYTHYDDVVDIYYRGRLHGCLVPFSAAWRAAGT
jgi:hypothetical protein